jgi:hypothetical protein
VVAVFFLWAFLSLKVPSKTFLGPAAPHGYVPTYAANGTQYYLVSLVSNAIKRCHRLSRESMLKGKALYG